MTWMAKGWAWKGCRHRQGTGMDRVWAWTGCGHGQGVGMDRVWVEKCGWDVADFVI